MKNACLEGALDRSEPCGVWGGQLIEDGVIIERKRRPGRPPRQVIAA
jgi:WhiB family redox-sensing transcriptional regulator